MKYQANPAHLQDQEQREQLCSESGRNSFNSTTPTSVAAAFVMVMLLLRAAGEKGECGFGVVFCWQKCRHCTFPAKKDPKSFLLNWIFSSHTTRAVLAGKPWDNLHSFICCRDQFFTILRAQWPPRPVWLRLVSPTCQETGASRAAQPGSLPVGSWWKKRDKLNFPRVCTVLVQPWRHLLCLFRLQAPPQGCSVFC